MAEDDLSADRLESTVVLDHLARHRWWYLVPTIVLASFCTFACQEFLFASWPGMLEVALSLAIFVAPGAGGRLGAVQQVLRCAIVLELAMLTLIGSGFSFLDIVDRATGYRLTQVSTKLTLESLLPNTDWWIAVAVCGGLALIGSGVLTILGKRPSRLSLIGSLLLISVACEAVALPAAWVRFQHNSMEFLAKLGPSTYGAVFGLQALCWALCALVLLSRQQVVNITAGDASATSPADKYVASGSSVAVTALLIGLFGITTCWGYADTLDRLIGVRTALASDLIATRIGQTPGLTEKLRGLPATTELGQGEAHVEALKTAWQTSAPPSAKPAWLRTMEIDQITYVGRAFLDETQAGVQFNVKVEEYGLPGAWIASPTLNFPDDLRVDHTLAAAADCVPSGDATETTYDKVYRACEKTALARGVKFPVVDVEMPVQYIVVASFIGILGCLMVFSDRVHVLMRMAPSDKIEPWILLDASRFGSRLLANGWVLALVVSPWLLIVTAVRIVALQVRAEGSVSSGLQDSLAIGALVCAVVMTSMISWPVLGGLLALRRVRHYQLGSARPKVDAEVPMDLLD